eukprot:gnl/TRDRNA2_/TRDRNA2_82459_c0_seq1.p1 gnl/TRDRNA2_/TRDRNA2_82459_c0~~gnl/TRDRNA2_/TRDRNA2_82459_c0_seq1.p1  ORF type:complete len:228 (+),score=42.05 gnl/TRDRNA2_/TRDRNA2_82459_c0_seq1:27-710(+)
MGSSLQTLPCCLARPVPDFRGTEVVRLVKFPYNVGDQLQDAKQMTSINDDVQSYLNTKPPEEGLITCVVSTTLSDVCALLVFDSQSSMEKSTICGAILEKMRPMLKGPPVYDEGSPVFKGMVKGKAEAATNVLRTCSYKCKPGCAEEFQSVQLDIWPDIMSVDGLVEVWSCFPEPDTFSMGMVFSSQAALDDYKKVQRPSGMSKLITLVDMTCRQYDDSGPVLVAIP